MDWIFLYLCFHQIDTFRCWGYSSFIDFGELNAIGFFLTIQQFIIIVYRQLLVVDTQKNISSFYVFCICIRTRQHITNIGKQVISVSNRCQPNHHPTCFINTTQLLFESCVITHNPTKPILVK